jgi:alkyl hydroperoxide reductase subunit AhpF
MPIAARVSIVYIVAAPPTDMTSATDYDVLIIGSGPAGLSAGLFTGRAGLETLIVTDGDPISGAMRTWKTIRAFPLASTVAFCWT